MQTKILDKVRGPHQGAKLSIIAPSKPSTALILLHGRGASAQDILGLTTALEMPASMLVCAPDAIGQQWYPHSFLEPIAKNQPHVDSALLVIEEIVKWLKDTYGIMEKQIVIGGFSQGACLTSQWMFQNPSRWGGGLIFSGGLIGSEEDMSTLKIEGDLENTPIYAGCDENDFFIPNNRVIQTDKVLQKINSNIETQIFSGLGHSINQEEILKAQNIISNTIHYKD